MPCYTLVQVEVKDEAMAKAALAYMKQNAKIEKQSGVYIVTPEKQSAGFRDKFLEEYQVAVATRRAKAEKYTVTRKEENGETVLVLRQY